MNLLFAATYPDRTSAMVLVSTSRASPGLRLSVRTQHDVWHPCSNDGARLGHGVLLSAFAHSQPATPPLAPGGPASSARPPAPALRWR